MTCLVDSARAHLNRLLVVISLVVALPVIAIAERCRAGSGRRLAVRATRALAAACGVRFVITQSHEVDPSRCRVLVANHCSLLDIPAILLARPDARFVAAADLYSNPLLRIAMRALGTIAIDREKSARARRQLDSIIRTGLTHDLVVFAEGGIVPAGQRLRFKSGAFVLAISARADIAPVAISGTSALLPARSRFAIRPGSIRVQLLEPIATAELRLHERKALRDQAAAVVTAALEAA